MVQDQSVNNTKSWKNLVGGLYGTFIKRRPSRQYMGGFINDVQSSFENISQEKIQSAIDIQPKIMEAIIAADGGHTTYMSNGSAKSNFDMKNIRTMGKSMIIFVFVNCPRVKNQFSRFTIDNNFSTLLIGHHGI